MKKLYISTLAASLLFAVSCQNDFENSTEDVVVTSGDANFSKYISLGNSLTSGYRDGALYSSGQAESYPSMLAGQMKLAGGGEFTQPLMPNDVGGFTNLFAASGGKDYYGKLTLKVVDGALSPTPSAPAANLDIIGGAGKYFSNMGVPGAKTAHLIAPGYGNSAGLTTTPATANPYFVRFATSAATSVVADALAQNPTFISLWIGNNDVLGYASTGGDGTNPITPVDGTVGVGFTSTYTYIINTLFPEGTTRKGVIANTPSVTSVPFFTTVPAKPLSGLVATQVTALNTAYATYNGGLAQAKALGAITDAEYQSRLIKFSAGAVSNGAVIIDKDLTNLSAYNIPSYRQTTSADYILLTASSVLKQGGGTATPLPDNLVLTEKEVAKVETATKAYNATIQSLAQAKGLAFVDANAKMVELNSASGIQWDGVKYSSKFVTGGAFSLDGVHPTGRGYGIIANEFLKAINLKYRSNLPMVNPNSYSGVTFP
jgi:hypothetical protein